MTELFLEWMPENRLFIALLSILANIMIALSGILPSAFLTAANIALFDFHLGLSLSIIGEAVGAIVSFFFYRKGLFKLSPRIPQKNKLLLKLQQTRGWEAVFLVLVLRTLPFVPSGVVTLFAAYSKMGIFSFSMASTLGKVPSLIIEAYAVKRALEFRVEWQLLILVSLIMVWMIYLYGRKRRRSNGDSIF
jgi:uncharacterized membrane protein YdjX (TVP38/TMEM64 family)